LKNTWYRLKASV